MMRDACCCVHLAALRKNHRQGSEPVNLAPHVASLNAGQRFLSVHLRGCEITELAKCLRMLHFHKARLHISRLWRLLAAPDALSHPLSTAHLLMTPPTVTHPRICSRLQRTQVAHKRWAQAVTCATHGRLGILHHLPVTGQAHRLVGQQRHNITAEPPVTGCFRQPQRIKEIPLRHRLSVGIIQANACHGYEPAACSHQLTANRIIIIVPQ